MKITDGLFHKVFDEVATEYPEVQNEHWIVDIGAAKMADTPNAFDVIVMPNLYGDILSDVAAQIAGSVGLAGSANIGLNCAMFEAIHGSAPRRANQNLANPSGLLLGAVMMLVHIGQEDVAEKVHNGWLRTLEDGVHTYDIFAEGISKEKVGTREFANAVVSRLGQKPAQLKAAAYKPQPRQAVTHSAVKARQKKEMVGIDIFLDWTAGTANELGAALEKLTGNELKLVIIDNRGTKVYPDGFPETVVGDQWRCRFMSAAPNGPVSHDQIIALLQRIGNAKFDFIKMESLCNFDGQAGYSLGQGQ
jgi:isocitrate dehydrogenase